MNDIIIALIMGIVEGLTEFLPVSSTGHMIVTGHFLSFEGDRADTFKIFIQLGAVLAVVVLYWRRFVGFLQLTPRQFKKPGINVGHLVIGALPFMIGGVTVYGFIKSVLFAPYWVMISLVLGGILMIIADYARRPIVSESVDDITYKQALGIGLFQCFALWPGFSRSGSTIAGGMLLGTSQKAAAEFSFLLSVPIMVAATGYDLLKSLDVLTMNDFALFAVGFITAFLVALAAIVTFLNVVKRLRLSWFAYYRFLLAGALFVILYL